MKRARMDMQSALEQSNSGKRAFWRSQFAPGSTLPQTLFDLVFGIAAPVFMVLNDPLVFNFMLLERRVFCLATIFFSLLVIGIWLTFRRRLGLAGGLVTGGLFFGALFAIYIAAITLRLSGFAILMAVSSLAYAVQEHSNELMSTLWSMAMAGLALIPALTAFVYIRNCWRSFTAFRHSNPRMNTLIGILSLVGLAISIAIPTITHEQASNFVSRSADKVVNGDPQARQSGIADLKKTFWCTVECYDGIVFGYLAEDDPDRQSYLALAYQEITGDDTQPRAEYYSQER